MCVHRNEFFSVKEQYKSAPKRAIDCLLNHSMIVANSKSLRFLVEALLFPQWLSKEQKADADISDIVSDLTQTKFADVSELDFGALAFAAITVLNKTCCISPPVPALSSSKFVAAAMQGHIDQVYMHNLF